MAVGATSVSLQSATDDDGVALPAGTYYFAIDGNNSQKEHIQAVLSGTALTSVQSVTRQGTLSSGCVRAHRVGATVTLTDFAHIKYMADLLSGATTFNASVPLGYDGTATISTANQFATKAYVDGVAIAGGADSSTTVKGITKMSVAPAVAASPIAVGDNDGRVPTQAENDALAATTTPSSSNLFVTQKDLQRGTELYAADAGANDTYVITLSPAPAAYVTGMKISFKANTANTGACTLNVNGLGAKTIKKFVSTDLSDNDILASQFVTVIYDGTNFVLQSTVSSFKGLVAKGTATKNLADASTTQNIAHGLGFIPVQFIVVGVPPANSNNNIAISLSGNDIAAGTISADLPAATFNISTTSGTNRQLGVITADATNIIITWTKTGSPTGTANLAWQAIA